MTFNELVKEINDAGITKENFGFGHRNFNEKFTNTKVDQQGGEGEGEYWYVVRYFSEHDIYIKLEGFYTSYDGVDFNGDDYVEVFPTIVTKTEYLTKKQ